MPNNVPSPSIKTSLINSVCCNVKAGLTFPVGHVVKTKCGIALYKYVQAEQPRLLTALNLDPTEANPPRIQRANGP